MTVISDINDLLVNLNKEDPFFLFSIKIKVKEPPKLLKWFIDPSCTLTSTVYHKPSNTESIKTKKFSFKELGKNPEELIYPHLMETKEDLKIGLGII